MEYYQKAMTLKAQRNFHEAGNWYEKAIDEGHPEQAECYNARGECLEEQGELDNALREFEKALRKCVFVLKTADFVLKMTILC